MKVSRIKRRLARRVAPRQDDWIDITLLSDARRVEVNARTGRRRTRAFIVRND